MEGGVVSPPCDNALGAPTKFRTQYFWASGVGSADGRLSQRSNVGGYFLEHPKGRVSTAGRVNLGRAYSWIESSRSCLLSFRAQGRFFRSVS